MLLFSSAYNEYTVISKEYTGPLDFDITGVDCMYSILSLVRTPGDRQNLFALSGIRINRCLKYLKCFEGN